MNDTPKEIAEFIRRRLLALSGADRVLMGSRMFDSARAIMLASFPSGISELEKKRQLCERLYGNEVDVAAFVESLTDSLDPEPDGHSWLHVAGTVERARCRSAFRHLFVGRNSLRNAFRSPCVS